MQIMSASATNRIILRLQQQANINPLVKGVRIDSEIDFSWASVLVTSVQVHIVHFHKCVHDSVTAAQTTAPRLL